MGERANRSSVAANAKAHAHAAGFGRIPIYFVPNRGQADDRIDFYVQGDDKTVYFSPDGLTLATSSTARPGSSDGPKRWTVKLDFLGARVGVKPEGMEETGAAISYFRGRPEEWKSGLPAYSRIIYRDLWPGIDLVYKGELDRLKYEFIVHPGADPSMIRLAYRGAEQVVLTKTGGLSVETPLGGFKDDIPVAYQDIGGRRTDVTAAYALELTAEPRSRSYGFMLGPYDRSQTLVIDPTVLVYCGYVGGAGAQDSAYALAVDSSGNAYITGPANSDETSFPVVAGPDLTYNGGGDAFVAKINSTGTGLAYCGYIGGADGDQGMGIAVDEAGNVYVSGSTRSTEATFPVTGGPDLTHNGDEDGFVAKINPMGTALVYCGYIGGSAGDSAYGIAVDASGNAYIAGTTSSAPTTFPVTVGPDLTYNAGDGDGFVAKVIASGTSLAYCGYIGGSAYDNATSLAVDGAGNAYVTGMTQSSQASFPDSVGPDLTYNGGGDLYVAKVVASGAALAYCGYIGGSDWEEYSSIAVDASGNAYIAGSTGSTETTLPVKVGPDLTHNGGWFDGFVVKVNTAGTGLAYCGYIGGSDWDTAPFIVVDSSGHAYVAGSTGSSEASFPVVDGPDLTYNGDTDGYVAKVTSSGAGLVYCGYIGGSGTDACFKIAVDGSGNAYVTGITVSDESTFPVFVGPDLSYNGDGDAFVAKVGEIPGPPVTSLLPDGADAGDPGLLLSVIGSEFEDGAIVRWDGSPRTTTFISSSELQATIEASDLAAGKTVSVTVRNPNGGISNSLPFAIDNPVPSLTSTSPTSVTGGGAAFTLTVQGSNFVPNSVVRWNGSARTTTYVSATELQAAILSSDLATGGDIQVTVYNPAPSGGTASALVVRVSTFALASTPTSATVTAGQSATYTIEVTPQNGSFDSAVILSCAGLPTKCTATFSPASVTPGAASVTTSLTLATQASTASAAAGSLSQPWDLGPGTGVLLALAVTLFMGTLLIKRSPRRLSRRWIAAWAVLCLVLLIGSCSSGGDDNNPPPYNGTPKGTHTISVQATSGNMTVPASITLVVN